MRFTLGLVLAGACGSPSPVVIDPDTGGSSDTDVDTDEDTDSSTDVDPEDRDGDGFLHWEYADSAEEADCDDLDPTVTPATERFVPAGVFTLGDDIGEPDQTPARQIQLSAYCIDVFEVTNERFVAFLSSRAAVGQPNQDDQGRPLYDFEDDDDSVPERIIALGGGEYDIEAGYEAHPVTEVWHWSAAAFCDTRAQALPTEAQWERAAKGPDAWFYPWGNESPSCELGNIRPGREGVGSGGQGVAPCIDDTTPVGSYASVPGAFGTYDMAGNVAEWVHDWYRADAYSTALDTDPTGPSSGWSDNLPGGPGEARVTRGGSFATGDYAFRTIHRYVEPADATSNGVGFRCAREI